MTSPGAWNYQRNPARPGAYGNYTPGYPYRVAAAQPQAGNSVPTLTPPASQPRAPVPQPALTPQPVGPAASGPFYDEPGYGCGGCCGAGGCRSLGEMFGLQRDPCYQPKWYLSGAGLFLTRDDPNGVWTTLDNGSATRLMQTTDANVDWRGGYEVKLGGRFGPGNNWAIEGDYWTIDRFLGNAGSPPAPSGAVRTPLVVNDIQFGGVNGDTFFNNAADHRLQRINRVQSAEVNLVYRFGETDPCCWTVFDLSVSAGPRYFQFDELLTFGGLANGGTWGGAGGVNEAFLSQRVYNTLIGLQLGADAGYHLARSFRLFLSPKIGFYNNHIQTRFDALRGDGVRAVPTAGTGAYPAYGDTDAFSFMAQIDAGVDWQFAPQWSAFLGYRLVAATGIGLADHQIPTDVRDFSSLSDVKHNGNLLVHGAFAGIKLDF